MLNNHPNLIADGKFQTEETGGIKQDKLIEKYTSILQDILIEKQNRWCKENGSDFYSAHPDKDMCKALKNKIEARDIRLWDTSLCVKWLLEFTWQSGNELSKKQIKALDTLRQIRNSSKHRAKASHVSDDDFKESCQKVMDALTELGIKQTAIQQIINEAGDTVIINKQRLSNGISEITKFKMSTSSMTCDDKLPRPINEIRRESIEDRVLELGDVGLMVGTFVGNPVLCGNWKSFYRRLGLEEAPLRSRDTMVTIGHLPFKELFTIMMQEWIAKNAGSQLRDLLHILTLENNILAVNHLKTAFRNDRR